MMQRQQFHFATGAGVAGDTGPPFFGEVHQMRWYRDAGDTGGTLAVGLMPDAGDTGPGITFLTVGLTPNGWLKFPRQPSHDASGDIDGDTGAPISPEPIVASGDHLRLKLTPGGTGVTGRLYVWIKGAC